MSRSGEDEVPEGAAVFPTIPAGLQVDPLLLAVVHALVFLAGSDESLVHPAAGDEALQAMTGYLQRLRGPALARVREDVDCLLGYARSAGWPRQLIHALKLLLRDTGLEVEGKA